VDAAGLAALPEAEARAREAAAAELASVRTLLAQAEREAAEARRMRAEITAHRDRAALAGALEQELRGNRFIAYVQREAMAVLAQDAAARLEQLTAGRYRLIADDGEFTIVDQFNGDEQRSVRTLSGGETFLASLALALALSERLPELAGTGAAVSLESLFLDEGFGALDAESLDLAVQGLETLAGGRRMIGVISHVPELAERLPDRIQVVPGVHGSAVASG
jgi:exonuclease SbcC